jgi:hypothetical protein
MTNLIEQIEAMRTRMNELAAEDQRLTSTLGDALASVDQRLLEGVRRLAAEHEARRGAILQELQTLAGRLFVLPRPREQVAALEEAPQEEATRETGQIVRRGDWRQAAATIQEELAHHLKNRAG